MAEREPDGTQEQDAPLPGAAPPGGLDAAEPAGEGEPGNERELEDAVDRPAAFDEPEHAVPPPEDPRPKAAEPPAAPDGGEASGSSEPDAGPGSSNGAAGEQPEAEEDELGRARRERDEYLALAQRTQADFENYRKRAARDSAAAGDRAKANLVRELLTVVDNLERALAAAGRGEGNLQEGVQLVHSSLVGVLARTGVEAFDPAGEPFDPTVHEALSTRQQDGAEPGVVLDVVEKGYRMSDSVLRPARVIVSG
jgi:molecular chaperone GrpE